MNAKILGVISGYDKSENNIPIYWEGTVVNEFTRFLVKNGFLTDPIFKSEKIYISIAGKNFGTFDKLFLEKLPQWNTKIHVRQRILDPAILFVDWKNDEALPSLTDCLKRNGEKPCSHDALEDAWDVIRLLRAKY